MGKDESLGGMAMERSPEPRNPCQKPCQKEQDLNDVFKNPDFLTGFPAGGELPYPCITGEQAQVGNELKGIWTIVV